MSCSSLSNDNEYCRILCDSCVPGQRSVDDSGLVVVPGLELGLGREGIGERSGGGSTTVKAGVAYNRIYSRLIGI